MIDNLKKQLIELAQKASLNAYAPYSQFKVGAALVTRDGKIYTGCNVENSSFSMTICAERNAVFQAVAAGNKDIAVIAIFVDSDMSFPPCGACRQVLSEFADDMPIYIANKNKIIETTLAKLLPERFSLKND